MKKVYIVTVEETPTKTVVHRHNIGFNLHELLGILEETQLDLLDKCRKDVRPEVRREVTIIKERLRYTVQQTIVLSFLNAQDAFEVAIDPPAFIEFDGQDLYYDGKRSTTDITTIHIWLSQNKIKKEG